MIKDSSRYRSHFCGELRGSDIGGQARLAGWLHRKRDHGELLFIDLRDHTGVTQCLIEAGSPHFSEVEELSLESVVMVVGQVVARSSETLNRQIPTGMLELKITEITLLSGSAPLPITVNSDAPYPEDLRLKYRYLDLRKPEMQQRIRFRDRVIATIREQMRDQNFVEIQTPILTAASPEGARDFLVPSRLHSTVNGGRFYALPQAPQVFKQLLMVGGFDRYFQIAPCFRDEDARADRSPGEFYQLDFEMAFVDQEDVFRVTEKVLYQTFAAHTDKRVSKPPFTRITYREAIDRFGTDKPDLRNGLEFTEVSEIFRGGGFRVFARIIEGGGTVRGLVVKGGGARPRAWFDRLNAWARDKGAAGLGYIAWQSGSPKGPIAGNLEGERLALLRRELGIEDDDAVFFVTGDGKGNGNGIGGGFAGVVRDHLASDLKLINDDSFQFLWVTDFPMFEEDSVTGKIGFSHNPFSMPQGGIEALRQQNPLSINAWQYDIVCNGVELSSGAIRNHEPETLIAAFEVAGYSREQVEKLFGGLLSALRFGAPPHGGSAPGIERILMLLCGCQNIREVTPFPLNQTAQDLMLGAPGEVDVGRLKELGLKPL